MGELLRFPTERRAVEAEPSAELGVTEVPVTDLAEFVAGKEEGIPFPPTSFTYEQLVAFASWRADEFRTFRTF